MLKAGVSFTQVCSRSSSLHGDNFQSIPHSLFEGISKYYMYIGVRFSQGERRGANHAP